jgi:hypothetical protein
VAVAVLIKSRVAYLHRSDHSLQRELLNTLALALCPLCRGQGHGSDPRNPSRTWLCPLCDPDGCIPADLLPLVARLSDHMHDAANAMQRGDADEAARLARVAARVAQMLLRSKL